MPNINITTQNTHAVTFNNQEVVRIDLKKGGTTQTVWQRARTASIRPTLISVEGSYGGLITWNLFSHGGTISGTNIAQASGVKITDPGGGYVRGEIIEAIHPASVNVGVLQSNGKLKSQRHLIYGQPIGQSWADSLGAAVIRAKVSSTNLAGEILGLVLLENPVGGKRVAAYRFGNTKANNLALIGRHGEKFTPSVDWNVSPPGFFEQRFGNLSGGVNNPTGRNIPNNGNNAATPASGGQGTGGRGSSDIRLKHNIEFIGLSPSGLKVYEFDYIDKLGRYQGVMAQDLLEINNDHPAITVDSNGYYMVDYDYTDVEFKMVENVLL